MRSKRGAPNPSRSVVKQAMLINGVLRSGPPLDADFEKKRLAFQNGS
jgi:hypothetical protein